MILDDHHKVTTEVWKLEKPDYLLNYLENRHFLKFWKFIMDQLEILLLEIYNNFLTVQQEKTTTESSLEVGVGVGQLRPGLVGHGPHDDAGPVLVPADKLAEGVLVLLQQRGRVVPEQVSRVSFQRKGRYDDIETMSIRRRMSLASRFPGPLLFESKTTRKTTNNRHRCRIDIVSMSTFRTTGCLPDVKHRTMAAETYSVSTLGHSSITMMPILSAKSMISSA